MSQEDTNKEEAISQFVSFTGADVERAKSLLEACSWNIELAVNMHVDTDYERANKSSSSRSNPFGASSSNSRQGVASTFDEGGYLNSSEQADLLSDEEYQPSARPRRAQTEMSAGASGRSSNSFISDDVRPPIPPVRQILVHNPVGYNSSDFHASSRRYNARAGASSGVYDAFRDFRAEADWQEKALNDNEASPSDPSASTDPSNVVNKRRTLQDLFRPPLDLIFRGSWVSAREAAQLQNKWLLVNIQNSREFKCQTLNRDVWSNQAVKDILRENFTFWQVYHDSNEGSRYIQFYEVSIYPHISIIDPRTGEKMKTWPQSVDHNSFCDSITEFLTEHPSPDGSSDSSSMKKLRVKEDKDASVASRTLYDQSEDAQLEAAIRASLQDSASNSTRAFADEDSYTDAIESDSDLTQSPFNAQTSNSSSSAFDYKSSIKARASTSAIASNSSNVDRQQKHEQQQASNARFREIGIKEAAAMMPENSHQPETEAASSESKIEELEDYTKYLGVDTEKISTLVVKYPDGGRDVFKFPADTLMKALFLRLSSRGYDSKEYNYVSTFPRRLLHEIPCTQTLRDASLMKDSIFVERRTCEGLRPMKKYDDNDLFDDT